MNKRSTKRALLTSVLSLVLCLSMLIGTTFAWFTDSVTSSNNIIKSGRLDVALEHKDMDETTYKDASQGAIFDYQLWEPGYVQVKHVKVSNLGNLAFKYQVNIYSNILPVAGEVNLADVIDVYVFEGAQTIDRAALASATPVGTLTSFMNGADPDGAAYGVLLPKDGEGATDVAAVNAPKGEVVMTIALKMQESAGNEYQNLSVGDGFTVQLLATQFTWEKDSFDEKYDADAEYAKNLALPVAPVEKGVDFIGKDDLIWNPSWGDVRTGDGVKLDTGYIFTAPETGDEADLSPYRNWHADFVVSFDKNVPSGSLGIAGNYGTYNWIGFRAFDVDDQDGIDGIPAGTKFELLNAYSNGAMTINYYELCELVEVFKCGAWAETAAAEGITMTVELVMFETLPADQTPDNSTNHRTGNEYVLGSYKYTF